MSFGEKLKEARAAVGMTQQALSEITKIPKRSIENWEAGSRTPPEYMQQFLLNELGFGDGEKSFKDRFVPREAYDRVCRERDIAVEQLKECNRAFGEDDSER